MAERLVDIGEVRRWVAGQSAAAERIERERVHFLRALTCERALDIYLELWESGGATRREPSVLLMSIRRCLERWSIVSRSNQ